VEPSVLRAGRHGPGSSHMLSALPAAMRRATASGQPNARSPSTGLLANHGHVHSDYEVAAVWLQRAAKPGEVLHMDMVSR